MRFKIKEVGAAASLKGIVLSESSAQALGVFFGDLVQLKQDRKLIDLISLQGNIHQGYVGVPKDILESYALDISRPVTLARCDEPNSLKFILKKLKGNRLSQSEFSAIVDDITSGALSESAIAYFVSAMARNGMSVQETLSLTKAMAYSGDRLKWGFKVIGDKHCVGGIPGNRTTPIVVAICAAAGLPMPKTSSRAITSAAGTADSMEVLTKVALPTSRLKEIVRETNACLAWGGALGLAPADDLLIHVEKQLNLDPTSQIVASILSKKIAAGSTHILIDIPAGKNAKVSMREAKELQRLFKIVGSKFNLKIKSIITDGTKPIGQGVGPVLEIRDVLAVLQQTRIIKDLEDKSIFLAGELLELAGKAAKGKGSALARETLKSGSAFMKFQEIIAAQGAVKNPNLAPGPLLREIAAPRSGKLAWHNQAINNLAKSLGCPEKNRAGVFLSLPQGSKVNKGDTIMVLYASDRADLEDGMEFLSSIKVFDIL